MAVDGLAVSEAESCVNCSEEFDYMMVTGSNDLYRWICPACGSLNSIEDEESDLEFKSTIQQVVGDSDDNEE